MILRRHTYAFALTLACGFALPVHAQNPPKPPATQPQQPQLPPVTPRQSAQPKAPFELSPEEQKHMDALLINWEKQSDKVKSFKCDFTRWDYDTTFGPQKNEFLMSERVGEIKFRAPDNGTFKEVKMRIYDAQSDKYVESKEELEHWVCDGKAIYQFKPKVKTLEITELPKEMRGKAITDGPLPFVFGAKAATLKQRYWIEETTPEVVVGKQIWLRAWPKFAMQAADFKNVEVILSVPDMLPVAMQVFTPNGKDKTAYQFGDEKNPPLVNNMWEGIKDAFAPPMTPPFWKKVYNPANQPPTPAAQAPPAPNANRQAQRPAAAPARK